MVDQWFVLSKQVCTRPNHETYEPLKYDRVRIVTINTDGYMSCSCGYIQRMLMPCRHVCAIIKEVEFYTPSLFHIRWYKLYNYYYKNNRATMNGCKNMKDALETLLLSTRSNAYNTVGKYKGIYIKGTPFHTFLLSQSFIPVEDNVSHLMDNIINETNQCGYALSRCYTMNPNIQILKSTHDEMNNSAKKFQANEFGGNASVSVHLSQDNQQYQEDNDVNIDVNDNSYYKRGLPLYEDMMRSCTNEKQLQECLTLMSAQHYKHVAEKGTNASYGTVGTLQLFGEDRTNRKHIGRHKTFAENLTNSRK